MAPSCIAIHTSVCQSWGLMTCLWLGAWQLECIYPQLELLPVSKVPRYTHTALNHCIYIYIYAYRRSQYGNVYIFTYLIYAYIYIRIYIYAMNMCIHMCVCVCQ